MSTFDEIWQLILLHVEDLDLQAPDILKVFASILIVVFLFIYERPSENLY